MPPPPPPPREGAAGFAAGFAFFGSGLPINDMRALTSATEGRIEVSPYTSTTGSPTEPVMFDAAHLAHISVLPAASSQLTFRQHTSIQCNVLWMVQGVGDTMR